MSLFYYNADKYDARLEINIEGDDRKFILDNMYFELPEYKIYRVIPDDNHQSYKVIYLFKKIDFMWLKENNRAETNERT